MTEPSGTSAAASRCRPPGALRRIGCAVALIALVGGCGSDKGSGGAEEGPTTPPPESTSSSDAATTTSAPAPPNGISPRALPSTFVELETDEFPRPAAEACADNETVTHVEAGESVADAVRDAEPGTTVEVEPGTYSDDNEGDFRALVLEAPDVCLRAAGGGEVVISPSAEQNIGIAVRADEVVIEGFTMRGFEVGVGFDKEEGQTINDVTLERVKVGSPAGDYREGIIAFGDNREAGSAPALDGLLLLDVTVEGTDQGISCNAGPCEHWWLENVSVTGRQQSEGSGADTFAIEEGRQIAVVSSSFAGAAADGVDTKAEDVVVYGTRVSDIGRNGVKLWKGGDVINTLIDGTGADAALVGAGPARYRYLHVIVAHHGVGESGYVGSWGYDAGEPVELEIVNSIFFENATGGLYVTEGSTVSIRNTIFDDPDSKLLDVGGSTYLVSDLAEVEALGWASGVIVGDPGFSDGAGGDFTTASQSPARDSGEVIEGLEIDIAGQPRSVGRAPDAGPYEAQD
ncbi:MAG: hypothetical protein EDR02_13065 [Actinobacteria bacterium]|nr:MAG: hypothetical protein EDR02_13065 [Actinomycetota bacterium]RIK04577.1 MAG: hypothetical protein DCC48_12760 [Acidobacteriota bacterium]